MGLDEDYVTNAGQAIASEVYLRGRPVELAYTPGNMTLYELVLIPWTDGFLSSAADWMDHPHARSLVNDRPELRDAETGVLVCWLGHGCWPVNLSDVPAPSYLQEKFDRCTLGDAQALCLLMSEAAGAARLNPPVVGLS